LTSTEKYRQHAADCLRLAQWASDRTALVEMAAAWLRLAERACSAPHDAKVRIEPSKVVPMRPTTA
jgi:hypothetical protein